VIQSALEDHFGVDGGSTLRPQPVEIARVVREATDAELDKAPGLEVSALDQASEGHARAHLVAHVEVGVQIHAAERASERRGHGAQRGQAQIVASADADREQALLAQLSHRALDARVGLEQRPLVVPRRGGHVAGVIERYVDGPLAQSVPRHAEARQRGTERGWTAARSAAAAVEPHAEVVRKPQQCGATSLGRLS
jgi:hypothetical protein